MTVNRWHTNPDSALRNSGDTIDAHQDRVADLVSEICAQMGLDGWHVIQAAKVHDEAERELGDMPATAKRRFPYLEEAYRRAEAEVLGEHPLDHLTDVEQSILDLADQLDAYLWAQRFTDIRTVAWYKQLEHMREQAAQIGVAQWLRDKMG